MSAWSGGFSTQQSHRGLYTATSRNRGQVLRLLFPLEDALREAGAGSGAHV